MPHIGIVGSGIAGVQLALSLQQHGITATIYSERTPDQELAAPIPNMVARNAETRARERQLGVNHWDDLNYDMQRLAVSVTGTPIAFSGRFSAPVHAVDMRIYVATLLNDFAGRGGRVVTRTFQADQLDDLASQHDLLMVASGRSNLSTIFPRDAAHSPYDGPQRLVVAGLFRGVRFSEPRSLEVNVSPGSGEILAVPIQSFEADLTGIGIFVIAGGRFESLRHLRYKEDPQGFIRTVLDLLREHAPQIHERVDPRRFDLSRPLDLKYAAITPTVRRSILDLANGRCAVALGDAHVVIDPITGQGANNASHAAAVWCEAIRHAEVFDRSFCERVEAQIHSYVIPVSDASNARLQPPSPHVRELLIAATRDQHLADLYADGYNHPDRFWAIASSPERTAAVLQQARTEPASLRLSN